MKRRAGMVTANAMISESHNAHGSCINGILSKMSHKLLKIKTDATTSVISAISNFLVRIIF